MGNAAASCEASDIAPSARQPSNTGHWALAIESDARRGSHLVTLGAGLSGAVELSPMIQTDALNLAPRRLGGSILLSGSL